MTTRKKKNIDKKKEQKGSDTISELEFEKLKKSKDVIVTKMDFKIIRTIDSNGEIIIHDPPCEVFFVTNKTNIKKK